MKYETPKQHLKKLQIERLLYKLKFSSLIICFALAIWILYACLSSTNDTKKMNECLKKNSLNYCNKNIK